MRIGKRIRSVLAAVALLVLFASGAHFIWLATRHVPSSFEERRAAATSRLAGTPESLWIMSDPKGAARAATAFGDFRLIQYHVSTLGGTRSDEPLFAGVDCAFPTGMEILLTRGQFGDTISDIAFAPQPPVDQHVAAVRTYNLAVLRHPDFPYADLCVPSVRRLITPPVPAAMAAAESAWWERLSSVPARAHSGTPDITIAARNGTLPTDLDSNNIDVPDEFGMTALAWAAARGSRAMTSRLLTAGADPWFGDYCETRQHEGGGNYAVDTGNFLTAPIVIAMAHHRQDVVRDMIAHAPRKACSKPAGKFGSVLENRISVVKDISRYASAYGFDWLRRRMLVDLFDQLPRFAEDRYAQYAYDDIVEFAWENGDGEIFKARPLDEIRRSRAFVRQMATHGPVEDVRYWIARLGLDGVDPMNAMFDGLHIWSGGDDSARAAFLAKVDFLLDAADRLGQDERDRLFFRFFAGEGSLGPLARDMGMVRTLMTRFLQRGYDVNRYTATEPADSFRNRSEAPEAVCSMLMEAISYAYRDECQGHSLEPELARLLLEAGADPNLGHTSSNLSALDLARRRAADGPYPEAFRQIEKMMLSKGARAGSGAPAPRN